MTITTIETIETQEQKEARWAESRARQAAARAAMPKPMTDAERHPDCVECQHYAAHGGPRHDASPRCESGKRSHCACDTCF